MRECNFSFKHYNELLKTAKKQYKFCFFSELPDNKIDRIYMRHDIDLSLEKALILAEIEHKNKIVSTFFIRLDTPYYNLFNPTFNKIVKKIIKLGHQIGLHFDEKICQVKKITQNILELEIIKQFEILERDFNINKVVSFHRPSSFVLNKSFGCEQFINTYQPLFFKKMKYISDSRGEWKEKCLCQLLKDNRFQNIQALIHPIWWDREEKDSNKDLTHFLKEKIEFLDNSISQDNSIYQKKFPFIKFYEKKKR